MKSSRLFALLAVYLVLGGVWGWLHGRNSSPAGSSSASRPSRHAPRPAPVALAGKWLAEGATREEWLERVNALLHQPAALERIANELEGASLDQALWNQLFRRPLPGLASQPPPFSLSSGEPLPAGDIAPAAGIRLLLDSSLGKPEDRLLLIRILLTCAAEADLGPIVDDLHQYAPAEWQNALIYAAYHQWCRLSAEAAANNLLTRDLSGVFGNPSILGLVIKDWAAKRPMAAVNSIASGTLPSPVKTQLLSLAFYDLSANLKPAEYRQLFDRFFIADAPETPPLGLASRTMLQRFFRAAGAANPALAGSLAARIGDPNKRDIARDAIKSGGAK